MERQLDRGTYGQEERQWMVYRDIRALEKEGA